MRRIISVAAVAVLGLGLMACKPVPKPVPKPTITATPSTLRPACGTITTVTGRVTPPNSLSNAILEYQDQRDQTWHGWNWFPTGASGEARRVITVNIPATGRYTLTYAQPMVQVPAIRLRVRGVKKLTDKPGYVSASWKVTRAPGSCS